VTRTARLIQAKHSPMDAESNNLLGRRHAGLGKTAAPGYNIDPWRRPPNNHRSTA